MHIVKYPEDITKKELLDKYSSRLLSCLKLALMSSYEIELNEESDKSWFHYLHENLDNDVNYIILDDLPDVRGYLVWKQHADAVHFYDLLISPKYQLDMITLRKLLLQFAYDIKDLNATEIWVYTNKKNMRMNALLKKHGFKVFKDKDRGTEYKADIREFIEKFIK